MIPSTDRGVEVQSNLSGEKIALSFDENSLEHLMSVLTDLYSDPELAVIREYATNALDAHREAGNTAPIEVELPGPLSPYLKIKDYGVGLDAQAIADTYSKYGASTKRTSNDQVGMLGLGCKSALTYASQFTVTGVKDGIKAVVSVSRDESGGGSMTVVDQSATDEPNGVEVVIPARSQHSLERKARAFFRYWEEGTVLVNGEPPEPLEGFVLSDDLLVVKNEYEPYGHDHRVVMGNVAYPADLDVELPGGYSLVARVPVGTVDFPPNREALMYTSRTKARIDQIEADFRAKAADAVQREIDAAPSRPEALKVLISWARTLPTTGRTFTYRNDPMPTELACPADSRIVLTDHNGYTLSGHATPKAVNVEKFPVSLFVQGYDRTKFTASHKKKLRAFAAARELDVRTYVLTKHTLNGEAKWIDAERLVDWETVNEIKLPRAAALNGDRIPGSYDLIINGQDRYEGLPANEIETKFPVYYVTDKHMAWNLGKLLNEEVGEHTLVILTASRVAKFERYFPAAKNGMAEARRLYDDWKDGLSDTDQTMLNIEDTYGARSDLSALDASRVDDPDLAAAIRLATGDLTNVLGRRKLFSLVLYTGQDDPNWDNPLDKYPLVSNAGYHSRRQQEDHIYIYINAVYAAATK